MSSLPTSDNRLQELMDTIVANTLAQCPWRSLDVALSANYQEPAFLRGPRSASFARTLQERLAILHRPSSEVVAYVTSIGIPHPSIVVDQPSVPRDDTAKSETASHGTRRQPLIENGESSTSETQTTSSLALRPSPTSSVDATQPEKTGGPTSSGNGSAAVFGNERHSTRPLSRQLAEISRYLAASSPKPPATPNCRERSSLAQAPPLSFTPEFTPPKARKRLTAADFFNPESAPKYGGSDPEPLEFSMQDVTELIQEEKSRAADRAQQRTTQPLDIQDEQHAYGEESSDVDDFPLAFRAEGTNPKAGRNRRTTRYHIKQRRKHYDETMFSQTKPVFPAPSGANAPVVRLPRSTTGLVRSSALGKRHVGSNGAVRDARQRHSSPRAGSKRSGQDLPPEEPKRQRRETRWDQRLDSREDRGRKEMQRRGPGARHGICDSWRPRYDGRD